MCMKMISLLSPVLWSGVKLNMFCCSRQTQVNQCSVPGIDAAYLAMDTEEGVEVVWNEVMISERKNVKLLEVRLNDAEQE